MTSKELRKKFLEFFEEKGHKVVPSSSLLPQDPSVLFTTAGMQQFKPYYLGEKSPYGLDVASCQKCFRTSDIEEIGDNRHLTFLEMLGNFSFGYAQDKSFGGYFKEKAIELASEFLIKNCCLGIDKLWITVFKGEGEIPEDKASEEIWQRLGIPKERIHGLGREDNFWGPTGEEGPCGPTSEIHYDLTGKPCEKKEFCVPNCSCGRFIELWNLVFNEYFQDREKKLVSLKQKGVDTGMGLERLAMVCQGKSSVYETDLFLPITNEIPGHNEKARRIIADHIKSAVFLISEGTLPSNVERGYILRRILRRAIRYGKLLDLPENFLIPLAQKAIEIYKEIYPEIRSRETDILTAIQNEEEKFEKTLEYGLKILHTEIRAQDYEPGKEIKNIPDITPINGFFAFTPSQITPGWLFKFYQSFALDPDLVFEEIERELHRKYTDLEKKELINGFESLMKKHQEISRAGAGSKFGGVGKEAGYEETKLHTATHLLHAALREVLGKHVQQMGSDITLQRLRFDFSHSAKMSDEEIKKVEDLVNQKIQENLEVKKEEMNLGEALKSGALSFFKEKYPERVTVYLINNPSGSSGQVFSKEICAGPHVKRTSELGQFKIIKEESSGAGVRRIRGVLQ